MWVSSFGDLRIKGCYTPPRSLSQLRHVLHRLLVSRHPPYTLGFYWEPKKPFRFAPLGLRQGTCKTEPQYLFFVLERELLRVRECFCFWCDPMPTDEKTSLRMEFKVDIVVARWSHLLHLFILLLKRQYKHLYIFRYTLPLGVTAKDTIHWQIEGRIYISKNFHPTIVLP